MMDSVVEPLPDLVLKLQDHIAELRRAGDLALLLLAAEDAAEEIERRVGEGLDHAAREALRAVKRFTYNASADCWPGWGVPKSPPNTQVLERALRLAERSAGLVRKLGLGPLQEGTGVWLCGAHELALGRHQEAHRAFSLAREHYIAAEAPGLALLAEGYITIVCEVAGDQIPVWESDLDLVCGRISAGGFEDGVEWIEQLRTALQVFTSR